ncbi:hypothetical protein B0H14DRAFT_3129768 [Mycena olivaceomarginata]|nr:hypothetical protein B0H14DRAFT_3129768 [Mycena olivaceomarginata]
MFLRGIRHSPRLIARFQTRWASNKVVHTFKLADIGEGITECEVIRWSVSPRATITAFDPLCEVQSDKASVEITSPFDGVVKELLVQEGQVAKVGQGLCTIEVEEEAVEGVEKASGTEEPAKPRAKDGRAEGDACDVRARGCTESAQASSAGPIFQAGEGFRKQQFPCNSGVDLALLAPGSGKGGRVEKADVEAYLSGSSRTSTPPSAPTQCGEDIVVELGRTRHAMYRAMVKSLEIPLFGYSTTLDITDLHALLPILNAHIPTHYLPPSDAPPPFNPALALGAGIPAVPNTLARTMMDWPLLRASITPPPSSAPSHSTPGKPTLTIRPARRHRARTRHPHGALHAPPPRRRHAQHHAPRRARAARALRAGPAPPRRGDDQREQRGGDGRGTGAGAGAGARRGRRDRGAGEGGVGVGCVGAVLEGRGGRQGGRGRGAEAEAAGVVERGTIGVVEGAELASFVEAWRGWVEAPTRLIGEGV